MKYWNKQRMSFFVIAKLCLITLFLLIFLFLNSSSFSSQKRPASKEHQYNSFSFSLIGVVVSKSSSSSLAVLRNKENGKTVMLTIGDTIRDMELIQVFRHGIVLKKDSETCLILLGRNELISFAEITKKNSSPTDIIRQRDDFLVDSQLNNNSQTKEFIRAEVVRRANQEWPLIIKDTRVIPNYISGKMNGVKIINLPKSTIISEIDIHRNDVILEVNGVALDDLSTLFRLYSKIFVENQFEVLIERDGKRVRHIYVLK